MAAIYFYVTGGQNYFFNDKSSYSWNSGFTNNSFNVTYSATSNIEQQNIHIIMVVTIVARPLTSVEFSIH